MEINYRKKKEKEKKKNVFPRLIVIVRIYSKYILNVAQTSHQRVLGFLANPFFLSLAFSYLFKKKKVKNINKGKKEKRKKEKRKRKRIDILLCKM
jgi:transcription antitermination factor NusG